MGKEGSLKEPANVRGMETWDVLEANKTEIEEDLAEITRKEQQLWLDSFTCAQTVHPRGSGEGIYSD